MWTMFIAQNEITGLCGIFLLSILSLPQLLLFWLSNAWLSLLVGSWEHRDVVGGNGSSQCIFEFFEAILLIGTMTSWQEISRW